MWLVALTVILWCWILSVEEVDVQRAEICCSYDVMLSGMILSEGRGMSQSLLYFAVVM